MLEDHLRPKVALWLHIAVGVCLGIVAAALLIWGVALWTAAATADAFAARQREATEKYQRAQAESRRSTAAAERDREQQFADDQRTAQAARAHRLAEAEARELAWTRFYRKPPACDEAKGGTWSVDCANDYIRARKRFADEYDAGKL